MIVLDINVLSAVMRSDAEPTVVRWLDRHSAEVFWTTSITVFEVRFGLELLAAGRKRLVLENGFARVVEEDLEGRVLSFDRPAAASAAVLAAAERRAGRTPDIRDMQIAGITASRRATLATRNTRHFEGTGIALVNPWSA